MSAEYPDGDQATPPGLDTQQLKHQLAAKMFGEAELDVPTLGRFTLIGRLGQGGMGTVFAAYDPHLDRKVALKVLRGNRSDPEHQARLLREAQSLARLSHPNVVSIHEVGTVDDQIFLALEYVSGGSLADEEERSLDTILEWMVQAGRGLEAAHEHGLVHRDIKPANILLTGDGRAKVSDFGLATDPGDAKILEETRDGAADRDLAAHLEQAGVLQTETGAIVGTPAFMAPEQIDGAPVDARTDQFAFCITLYRLLEGKPPFAGPTILAVRDSIASGPRPAKQLPAWLDRIVTRGLAEDPRERFPSMRELLDALERGRRPRDWKRPVTVVGLVGVIAGAWALSSRNEPVDPCSALEHALDETWGDTARTRGRDAFEATGRPYAADAWTRTAARIDGYVDSWTRSATTSCQQTARAGTQSDEAHDLRMECLEGARIQLETLIDLLAEADAKLVLRADRLVPSLPDLAACDRIDALRAMGIPPDDPNVDAAQRQLASARAAIAAGRMSEANEAAREAAAAAEASGWAPMRAEAMLAVGKTEQELGRLSEAEEYIRMAIDLAESSRADHTLAEGWIMLLSNVVDFQSRPAELDALARRAESSVRRIGDPPSLRVRFLVTLGRAQEIAGDLKSARASLEAAMKFDDQELPSDRRIVMLHQLAHVLVASGEVEQGIKARMEALDLARGELGDKHPTVAKLISSLAADYMDVPDNDRALALFDEAIALRDELGMPVAAPYGNRGQVLVNLGRPREALPDFERAIELFTAKVGAEHPTIGVFLLQEATAHESLGDMAEARRALEAADAKFAAHLPEDHPYRLSVSINLANVLTAEGEPEQALERAAAARKAFLNQSSPCAQEVQSTTEIVARAHLALGDAPLALIEYDAIIDCWDTRRPDSVDVEPSVKWGKAQALAAVGRGSESRELANEAMATYSRLGSNYAAETEQIRSWLASPEGGLHQQ